MAERKAEKIYQCDSKNTDGNIRETIISRLKYRPISRRLCGVMWKKKKLCISIWSAPLRLANMEWLLFTDFKGRGGVGVLQCIKGYSITTHDCSQAQGELPEGSAGSQDGCGRRLEARATPEAAPASPPAYHHPHPSLPSPPPLNLE